MNKIYAPRKIKNYYGVPAVWFTEDKFYFGLEDFTGWHSIEVSEEFFQAFVMEFEDY